jgi:hypothetical protein
MPGFFLQFKGQKVYKDLLHRHRRLSSPVCACSARIRMKKDLSFPRLHSVRIRASSHHIVRNRENSARAAEFVSLGIGCIGIISACGTFQRFNFICREASAYHKLPSSLSPHLCGSCSCCRYIQPGGGGSSLDKHSQFLSLSPAPNRT